MQLQETFQDGGTKILALEHQVSHEQDRCKNIQNEIREKDDEITRLSHLPPPL